MLRNTILSSLAHPDRAWIVLLAGIVMIYREFMRPGRVLPGVFGGVAVCVAVYSLFRHPWHAPAAVMILAAVASVIVQGFGRWYWLPCGAAAVLMTMGARGLTEPPISWMPAAASAPVCLVSGFLLYQSVAARRRKRSLGATK